MTTGVRVGADVGTAVGVGMLGASVGEELFGAGPSVGAERGSAADATLGAGV